ncbi:MAG TPA: ATP-binding protein [Ignavibacteriales bacterium]|nr:ATP-binding protein [Ignavibacteriales bacterium]HOL81982.1 ATP-binding protein [Ignavibacteriales bacterium]HOM64974.1 ATP-binding protein [Ignavibacteriales bacterium]HPD68326.1 ATP-binding protein [Ignavibacteriales bacterium]HPP34119.1 ATP-binding protein [Ignavibacteriales bacterium]
MKIAIASGKGGTGKTLVATNLFYVLQKQNYKLTLVDCDAEEPNDLIFYKGNKIKSNLVVQKVPVIDITKCKFCGRCREYCNYNAIILLQNARIINVVEDLCHGCGACMVACKFGAISEKEIVIGEVTQIEISENASIFEAKMEVGVNSPVPTIKAAIKEAGNEGIIILDSPPGSSCPFVQTVAAADYVILVTEPTPFGLSDLKQTVDALNSMKKPFGVVINKAGLGDNEIYDFLNEKHIPLLMEIPFNKDIAHYYSNGDLFIKNNSKMEKDFFYMFNLIFDKYGNSNN